MTELVIDVAGTPAPKGSLRHVGRGRMVEQVKGSKPWREAVAAAAGVHARAQGWVTATGPVEVRVEVRVLRPKSAPRRLFPVTRSSGDIDKHSRNVLDALVDARVVADDSQVVLLVAAKVHSSQPGARIRVRPVTSPAQIGVAA